MKKTIYFALSAIVLFCLFEGFTACKSENKGKTIAIVSIASIEPITQLENGFKKRINESAFAKSHAITFTYDNAQNDASLQNQIVDKIIRNKPDLVYVLGTPISTAIQKRDPNIIIVQGGATDPVEAGLANAWEASGKNYAATTDAPPIDKQILLIKEAVPSITSLGIIYNTGESNSVSVVKRVRKYIEDNNLNITLQERPVSNTSEVATATESLKGRVQAIYIPPDNTVHGALKVVCKLANDNKIPVFTSVETSLADGAFAALSLDYTRIGEESADIALMILEGKEKPSNIPIKQASTPKIIINQKVATALNISLDAIKKQNNVEIKTP